MKIGVISDTHVGAFEQIHQSIREALADVDLIVHAGDFTEKAVLDGLKNLVEVRAVSGNMDSAELKGLLPAKDVFVAGGKRIGLVHGTGGPSGIAGRVRDLFNNLDIIIFGHSHQPFNDRVKGVLLFNPGSARHSYGLITIDEDIHVEIVPVDGWHISWPL